jgi:hypothetical protein
MVRASIFTAPAGILHDPLMLACARVVLERMVQTIAIRHGGWHIRVEHSVYIGSGFLLYRSCGFIQVIVIDIVKS